jgi:hypothetical protein
MKQLLLLLFVCFANLTLSGQNVIISEVVSGSAAGGYPKYIELTNTAETSIDLNGYDVNIYKNGSVSSVVLYEFTNEYILPAKKSVVITNIDNTTEGKRWSDYNLSEPEYVIYKKSINYSNGDDVYELTNSSGEAVDVYGETGIDGSGERWDYYKSFAYRKSSVHSSFSGFDWVEWEYGGKNALDGHESDMSAFLTPGTHILTTASGSITVTNPVKGDSYQTGQSVTITWTQTGVTNLIIAARRVDETVWGYRMNSPVDAAAGSMDFVIPADAKDGDYLLKLIDFDSPAVFVVSDTFHISDLSFAGLNDDHPFYPASGDVDVPTDVFDNKLKIYFKERVQRGTGNIYIKRFEDDAIVRTFDVANDNEVVITDDEDVVQLVLTGTLAANTKFYVEVEAGAITDQAATPNPYAGFNDNSMWSFTTGNGDSYISIHDVQEPNDGTDDSPCKGSMVKVKGVVMFKYYDGSSYKGFYLQDAGKAWSGIYVYDLGNDDVNEGDSVTVAGTVAEVYGVTRLKDVQFKYFHAGSIDLYEPVVVGVTEIGEEYESVFVRVNNVTCTNPDLGSGEWEVVDGNNIAAIVDDRFYDYNPTVGEHFDYISGILHFYPEFMLEPLSAGDIASVPTRVSDVDFNRVNISPNPFKDEIRIIAAATLASVRLINIAGAEEMIINNINSNGITIPAGNLKKGLYIVKLITKDGNVVIRKIIKK